MRELIYRLASNPLLFMGIAIASIFANILALASPLFVIQVLNRYVAQGVNATLLTLVTGVLLAVIFEFIFRQIRLKLAGAISERTNSKMSVASYSLLLKAKASALERIPVGQRNQITGSAQMVETAYGASNIATVFDVPFSLLFIGVLYLLSPVLAGVTGLFVVAVYVVGHYGARVHQRLASQLLRESVSSNTLVSTACEQIDTVRGFNAYRFLQKAWVHTLGKTTKSRQSGEMSQSIMNTISQSASALLGVAIISVGAMRVVDGSLDVGSMIGANILAARALMPIIRLAQLGVIFAGAKEGLRQLREFSAIPQEAEGGSVKPNYTGAIEFKDAAFAYPGSSTPVFESFSFTIKPNTITVVCGENGAGKSTLARILAGVLDLSRGQVLVDGLDLQQASLNWWRTQIAYLPQEPKLLNATIRENILVAAPETDEARLSQVVQSAGLSKYLDESADGLESQITNAGASLSLGIRRRIALARALVSACKVAIFDEPTDGLDREGVASIYAVMKNLSAQGCSIIVISHDAKLIKGAGQVVDLNEKPTPRITQRTHTSTTSPTDVGGAS
ncbi:MAG: ATP-binding cassette domain-containing protein [Rhodospirillales bacterium]|jgi:ATP-binding cassette, subfamily C, bacterial LapB|nr:ATP-binding cassette domain-containing protein [Rhodospirillales bacterium]MBT4626028.1 ATP-binding cassette domain-containing protein [Rhodospirillales bacterium]MBT6111961.1 ATP-binding cassette domain-containing protein [Rhodospirillales bacterium]MBT6826952.1 ATP-binding cassette domain-containing protein [Rhodospirillales bacterium]MBT7147330.1 ATP-binding cassette domain-containing protein [Rhodospirillales bacterium]